MSNSFGHIFRIHTWGESHGKALGVVIDGCPAGIAIAQEDIQHELNKRKPGQNPIVTQRNETDTVHILSGIFEGLTTGTPISLLVFNQDHRSADYAPLKDLFRPGHADFGYFKKYGIRDHRGGGRSSGRETISRVAAAAIAKKVLLQKNIQVFAHTQSIGHLHAQTYSPQSIYNNNVRSADPQAAQSMEALILETQKNNDSIGGVIEARAYNVPAGLGEPVFDKLDADIAKALMSIGGVKGVEIGDGFLLSTMTGKEANDSFLSHAGQIATRTNHAGGILGGISTGMPIIVRVAVKASSSISSVQDTVDIHGTAQSITIQGRHDPCIVPRVVPVVESMMNLVLCDHLLLQRLQSRH